MTAAADMPRTSTATTTGSGAKTATLYRMAMPGHLCPFGLKSLSLLRRRGFEVDDHLLESRDEVDAFKAKHDVKTTPQTFIDGTRIGGYTDLKKHFGLKVLEKGETTYRPVLAIFGGAAAAALGLWLNPVQAMGLTGLLMLFFALSMIVLAVQKLQDVEGFVNGFLGYDLLARRYVPYGYAYPWLELYAGAGMLALMGTGSALIWLVAPVGLFIGAIGAVSVIKAVYVDKRELTCACVGGDSNVPLGAISLTENLVMVGMGLWMLGRWFWM